MRLDHLVVRAEGLEAGAVFLEDALGVAPGPGGRHGRMGTHNRLLSLGPEEYLEVIAVDPDAPPPDRPRWYGLDALSGPPALGAWAARTDDLAAALAGAPAAGEPLSFERGGLRWRMADPPSGELPLHGLHPALLQWDTPHPAPSLPDSGCRLVRLVLTSPEPEALRAALDGLDDPRITVERGSPGLRAEIDTPSGSSTLPRGS